MNDPLAPAFVCATTGWIAALYGLVPFAKRFGSALYIYIGSRLRARLVCILRVTTASVHSAFHMPAFGTGHHGYARACSLSVCWLRIAAAGCIRICKRRSDRFAVLTASCAIAEEAKVIEKLRRLRRFEAVVAHQYRPDDSGRLVR